MTSQDEWQIDQHGRKYRRVGNCIEYMPTVTICGVEVENTPEALEAFYEAQRKASEALREAERQREQSVFTGRICPFNCSATLDKPCKRDCALFCGDSCALAGRPAAADTSGKPCPFLRRCDPSCALYDAGCTLNNMIPVK